MRILFQFIFHFFKMRVHIFHVENKIEYIAFFPFNVISDSATCDWVGIYLSIFYFILMIHVYVLPFNKNTSINYRLFVIFVLSFKPRYI